MKRTGQSAAGIDGAALALELRGVLGKVKRRLREQTNSWDLTPSQVGVLLRLEKDGAATVSSLARAEGMRPQSMSSVVAALSAAGLVVASPDPTDKRQSLLSLTASCLQRIREDRSARQDWLSRVLQLHLSAPERAQVAAAVGLLKRLTGGLRMNGQHLVAYFFGGVLLANAVPHLISGMLGRAFQSPFAKPPGQGLSSSTVNVVWGSFNLVVAYLLVCRVGAFDLRTGLDAAALGAGAFLMSLVHARAFGRFHGGNAPTG